MANPCKCPLTDKVCFAKRGHDDLCFVLTEPALYSYEKDEEKHTDCKFRKVHQSKPRNWTPSTVDEMEWAKADKKVVL